MLIVVTWLGVLLSATDAFASPSTGASVVPTSYDVEIDLTGARAEGVVVVSLRVTSERAVISLDAVDVKIKSIVARHQGRSHTLGWRIIESAEQLILTRAGGFTKGDWNIRIEYAVVISTKPELHTGIFSRSVAGRRFVFTQAQPSYARKIVPCFDTPRHRVPWKLTLIVPPDHLAVSNTSAASVQDTERARRVTFVTTKPLPTYLLAFAAGPFVPVHLPSNPKVRLLVTHKSTPSTEAALQLASSILEKSQSWIGLPFPYDKIDIVGVPGFLGGGGMENPGLIMIDSNVLMDEPSDVIMAHEIAHQWFGNLVSPQKWEHVWLSESLAEWMAHKVIGTEPPHDGYTQQALLRRGLKFQGSLRRASPRPTIDSFGTQAAIAKGVTALRLIESAIGEKRLIQVFRAYLQAHPHGTAVTDDFVSALSPIILLSPAAIDAVVVDGSPPPVKFKLSCTREASVLEISGGPTVPFCVAFDQDGVRADICSRLEPTGKELVLPTRQCPAWLWPFARGAVWYTPIVADGMRDEVLDNGWRWLNKDERASVVFEPDGKFDIAALVKYLSDGLDLRSKWNLKILSDLQRRLRGPARQSFDRYLSSRLKLESDDDASSLDIVHQRLVLGLLAGANAQSARREVLSWTWATVPEYLLVEFAMITVQQVSRPPAHAFDAAVKELVRAYGTKRAVRIVEGLVSAPDGVLRLLKRSAQLLTAPADVLDVIARGLCSRVELQMAIASFGLKMAKAEKMASECSTSRVRAEAAVLRWTNTVKDVE